MKTTNEKTYINLNPKIEHKNRSKTIRNKKKEHGVQKKKKI